MSNPNQNGSSTSPANAVDPFDLLDFSEYDGGVSYNSPSVSPVTTSKAQFTRPSTTINTPATMPAAPAMSGPSHQYDQYKQQTPFVPGALANTMAVNQSNPNLGYNLEFTSSDVSQSQSQGEFFDFNAPQSQNSEMDFDFDSPPEASFFFAEPTVNPNAVGGAEGQSLSPSTSNVGRMYPGMHQQAALAKAQAQQRQQQQIIRQQQQHRQSLSKQPQQQRPKSAQPSDPIVEQKITQLLNSMRQKPNGLDAQSDAGMNSLPRSKKDEEDMDDDERLLNSEEGKKLSSKERRQLRNKVSARAFRSRRKEYITQLEAEIATKVSENGDLRAQNRALIDENRRLSDLTRMLLSSPSFSNFLDHLSSNPAATPQQQQQVAQIAQVAQVEQPQQEARVPKDVNPYAGQQQNQQQQIGMAMIPEQSMDFSMLNLDTSSFNYQPQVFAVLETPEMPTIDTAVLAGKSSSFEVTLESSCDKLEIPVAESPVCKDVSPVVSEKVTAVEEAVADLDGDIFDDAPAVTKSTESSEAAAVFGGVELEKAFARIELTDASETDAAASIAFRRIERISASLEATTASLERLTANL